MNVNRKTDHDPAVLTGGTPSRRGRRSARRWWLVAILALIAAGLGDGGPATAAECQTTKYRDGFSPNPVVSDSATIQLSGIPAIRVVRWDVFANAGYSLQTVEIRANGNPALYSTDAHGVLAPDHYISRVDVVACPIEVPATTVPSTTPTTSAPTTSTDCPYVLTFTGDKVIGDSVHLQFLLGEVAKDTEFIAGKPNANGVEVCQMSGADSDGTAWGPLDGPGTVQHNAVTGLHVARAVLTGRAVTVAPTSTSTTTTTLPPAVSSAIDQVQSISQTMDLSPEVAAGLAMFVSLLQHLFGG